MLWQLFNAFGTRKNPKFDLKKIKILIAKYRIGGLKERQQPRQRERKKAIGLKSKTATLHVNHTFCHQSTTSQFHALWWTWTQHNNSFKTFQHLTNCARWKERDEIKALFTRYRSGLRASSPFGAYRRRARDTRFHAARFARLNSKACSQAIPE